MAFYTKEAYDKSKRRMGCTWLLISAADTPVKNQSDDIVWRYRSLSAKDRPFRVHVRDCGTGPDLALALAHKGIPTYVVDRKGKPLWRASKRPLLLGFIKSLLWFLK